ncbi:MAG TPA: MFS transporter [Candidatus Dormibacteraeota bacterium]|nr:MFS transporter [Candidatus Dormibacteraeota bacterium]
MLIVSLILGLALGLLAGGRIENLAYVRLRLVQLLFLGLVLRYATEFAIENGNDIADAVRLPLFASGFLLLLIGLWSNREHPGIALAFVGILLNAIAIVTNGGYMPVWQPSIVAAGLPPTEIGSAFHLIVGTATSGGITGDFLAQAGPLGDIIPIPIPFIRNVASIGDLFLASGLAFFLFAIVVREPTDLLRGADPTALGRRVAQLRLSPEEAAAAEAAAMLETGALFPALDTGAIDTALAFDAYDGSLVSAVALERPLSLGGPSVGSEGTLRQTRRRALPQVPPILERVRHHPYVRLALDSSFSALWTGQLISALGDRIHQVALAYLVLHATNSPIAVGAVFLTATLPNLIFGPIAGGLVDRWDQREVMIVSDLLRAGLVLLIPIAAVTNLALAYPLVFLVTTVSIFFRPAKGAILPRMVAHDDLVPANSALWVGETFADIGGYVLAGLFVALLGSQLPLAFWADSVTYFASALLIASVVVAPVTRQIADAVGDAATEARRGLRAGLSGFGTELREGWRFLRGDQVLLANTLQATAGQFMLGIFLVLTPVYAAHSIDRTGFTDTEAFAFMEGSIGAGNLVGGFLIGLIGSRLALGRMVIVGYVATGAIVALLPLAGSLPLALGIAFGAGIGNLAFVIPSQTLLQKRTPPELMGRVLGLRFSVVFGAMTLAMGIGGVLGEWFGAGPVLGVFGLITVAVGLAGVLVPAVRDA